MPVDTDGNLRKFKKKCYSDANEKMERVYSIMVKRFGSEKSITARELSDRLKISNRTVRIIMNRIVEEKGLPIASYDGTQNGKSGYFIISTREELDTYIGILNSKINPLEKKVSFISECFNKYYN